MAAQENMSESQTSETEESLTKPEGSGWEMESSTEYSAHPFKMMNPEEPAEEAEFLSETADPPAQPGAAPHPLRRSSVVFTIDDIPYSKWADRLQEFLAYLTH